MFTCISNPAIYAHGVAEDNAVEKIHISAAGKPKTSFQITHSKIEILPKKQHQNKLQ
jgi:hypothetical protein